MTEVAVPYLSQQTTESLWDDVEANLARYTSDGFADRSDESGWNLKLSITMDDSPLASLDPDRSPEAEYENSLRVWSALHSLTPALANENRIWTRLAHVECFEYARDRWLSRARTGKEAASIRAHFFANSQTRARDDNAVSRLWWNAYIAHHLQPESPEDALRAILASADIRQGFVERPWITTRREVGRAIVRLMENEPWMTSKENNFRSTMRWINWMGAGIVFEVMNLEQIDTIMRRCIAAARVELENQPN